MITDNHGQPRDFEGWLEDYFIQTLEFNGRGITKDNCETLYDIWSSELDINEVIELADIYAHQFAIWHVADLKTRLEKI